MGTIGSQRLRRSSFSSKRSRQTIKTIEAYLGRTIGGDTSDNKASQEESSKPIVANDNERSLDKANKR